MTKNAVNYDRVNLVNDNDEIIASADKYEAHLGEALLHQAISLFLFKKNQQGNIELLIQKRSQQKIVGAEQWANTVCGNVAEGETHQQCLWRRLRQELGINLPKNIQRQLKEIFVFNYHVACNHQYSEREIDHIFALFLDEQRLTVPALRDLIKLNPAEVSEARWVNWLELKENQQIPGLVLTPWFKLFLQEPKITQVIQQFLEESSNLTN